ncbi:MAG: hypothetical protein M5U27_11865 [Gaiella sp.]|nr:hypothetical protein [Gaiella sp.]
MPRSAVGPSGDTARARPGLLVPQFVRQSGSAAIASRGTPTTVTPEIEAVGPALAAVRRTGDAVSTPGKAA